MARRRPSPSVVLLCGLLCAVGISAVAPSARAAVSFTRADTAVGSVPAAVAVSDYNGDGLPDVAVANFASTTVSILLGNGGGGLSPLTEVPVGKQVLSLAPADLNLDGKIDLAVANWSAPSISILIGAGNGQFTLLGVVEVGGSPSSVVVGEFNGDGAPDIAVSNLANDAVSILLGDATGAFNVFTQVAVGDEPRMLAIGDFDVDGVQDLAAVNYGGSSVTVLRGAGNGTFTARPEVAVGFEPRSIAVGDFDANGLPDLVVGNFSSFSTSVSILRNDGSGGFTRKDHAVGDSPRSVAVADLNSDGWADVAVANHGTSTVSVLLNDRSGGFTRTDFSTGVGPYALTVGDLDRDAHPDVVVANQDANTVTVLINGDETPPVGPSCGLARLLSGSPQRAVITASDLRSGLVDVRVTSATNATVRIQPFAPFTQFTALGVLAVQTDPSQTWRVELTVTNGAGAATTCVVTPNPVPSTTTTVPVPAGSTPFVTSFTPTRLRQDFSGWIGFRVTVGSSPVSVSALGRWVVAGNTGTHTVKLVNAATGADVAGASGSIATAGAPANGFRYASLASPVTLAAGGSYYLVSSETAGGDQWYDYDTHIVTTSVAADTGVVYAPAGNPQWSSSVGSTDLAWGPPNFLYATSSPPSPSTTTPPTTAATTTTPPTTAATTTTPPTTAAPGGGTTSLVTSFTPTRLRQDFTGWVGYRLTVGSAPMTVSALGRWVVAGNIGTHTVKLVDAGTGVDVAGATVSVVTAGAPAGAFRYAGLAAPVTLPVGSSYYLVSTETAGGDAWYDYDTHIVTTGAASDTGIVYAFPGSPTQWAPSVGGTDNAFGPLSLLYRSGSSTTVAPTTVAPTTVAPTTVAPTTVAPTTVAPTTTPPTTVPPPAGGGTSFVTSFTPTALRQDFSGWVGYRITVGSSPLTVNALGRWVVAGNTGNHIVKLVDATTGADAAAATVSLGGATPGAFRYAPLASPVTLPAGGSYFLVSAEVAGGDAWYDLDTHLVTTGVASDTGPVYAFHGTPTNWVASVGATDRGYGPLSLLYGSGSATTTPTTSPPTSSTTIPPTTTTTTTPPAGATPFVTSFTPTRVRQDFTGWIGYRITVGPAPVTVSALGRWVVAGNSGTHVVKLVNAATGADVPGATASVATSGAPAGAFGYGSLASPVTLAAGASYYLVSSETAGGDAWYDYDTHIVTKAVAADTGVVYAFPGTPTQWNASVGATDYAFGPLCFLYG